MTTPVRSANSLHTHGAAFVRHSARITRIIFTSFTLLLCSLSPSLHAQELPTIEDTVVNTTAMEGYFNLYWDDASGKMYWEIDKLDTEFMYLIPWAPAWAPIPLASTVASWLAPIF